jgi:hypothetical protein
MHRDDLFAAVTHGLARALLPFAFLRRPGAARRLACQWALSLRFPAEDLRGLTGPALAAFTAARTEAFWRDRQLIGLTSGHRDAAVQHRLYVADVGGQRVLPPERSAHVRGIAVDVRPVEGARWLEAHGWRHGLYRVYDNEWWHFEYRVDGPPVRLPHPGATPGRTAAPGRPPAGWR